MKYEVETFETLGTIGTLEEGLVWVVVRMEGMFYF